MIERQRVGMVERQESKKVGKWVKWLSSLSPV
jgi:hypothetical protein